MQYTPQISSKRMSWGHEFKNRGQVNPRRLAKAGSQKDLIFPNVQRSALYQVHAAHSQEHSNYGSEECKASAFNTLSQSSSHL